MFIVYENSENQIRLVALPQDDIEDVVLEHLPDHPWQKFVIVPDDHDVVLSPDGNISVGDWDDVSTITRVIDTETLDRLKASAITALNEEHSLILRQLTSHVTPEERDTWQPKALAALAHSNGNAADFQLEMLNREATRVNETIDDLVKKILENNSAYHVMVGDASGHRRATAAAINAAPDLNALGLVLADAKSKAETLVADYLEWVKNAKAASS